MKLPVTTLCFLLISTFAASTNSFAAAQKYVTDEFEVTMRSGTSTSNNILQLLNSGEAVTVVEENVDARYSLVEIENGKKGYVLSRYLVDSPSSKFQLGQLQIKSNEQQESNALLQSQVKKLQASFEIQQSASNNLKSLLQATENELSRVRDAAGNTLNIVAKNEVLEVRVDELTEDNLMLDEENANLKDTNDMEWFIRGAGVSLIAFLLGILVTRIRWRKRDSWGS